MPILASSYDTLPIGVALVDERLRIDVWNQTLVAWSGVGAPQAIGMTAPELFPGFRADQYARRLTSVFRHGQTVVLSATMHESFLPLRHPSGQPLRHKTRISPLPDGSGRAMILIEDVTQTLEQLEALRAERRRLQASEASLRQQQVVLEAQNAAVAEARRRAEFANRAKSVFLANMSHEIRTPLTAINGFAELVCDHTADAFVADAAERIFRNGEHLLSVVNDILDLSKIEAGQMKLSVSICDPRAVIDEVVRLLEGQAAGKGLSLTIRSPGEVPSRLETDAVRLRQVLLNLVGNAIKFTERGSIAIEARAEGEAIVIAVSDTGKGIPADKLISIFDPFTQADESTQRRHGGTGLGLAICQKLLVQMDGDISVVSTEGVGSRFTVRLPLGESRSGPATSLTGETESCRLTPEHAPLAGVRVAVAEDGPDNRRLIDYLLRRAGAVVELHEHGRELVDAVREAADPPDAIVLDMQMPVMDGYAAAAALRRNGYVGPVIALTAHAMGGDRERALDAGCDAYVAKPIDAARFIGEVAARTRAVATGANAP